jgi:hypothetical protein
VAQEREDQYDAKKLSERALASLTAEVFVNHHVLDRTPWLFEDRTRYIEWKTILATEIAVDPFSIVVVGSAALGFSLSPKKGLSPFGERSDIDVAVVSPTHFDTAWRWLRNLGSPRLLGHGSFERGIVDWHRKNLVFDGAIATTDELLSRLEFGPSWKAALGRAGNREPTVGRNVKVRVYRDFESLRAYHVANIQELQRGLLADLVEATEGAPLPSGNPEDEKFPVNGESLRWTT